MTIYSQAIKVAAAKACAVCPEGKDVNSLVSDLGTVVIRFKENVRIATIV